MEMATIETIFVLNLEPLRASSYASLGATQPLNTTIASFVQGNVPSLKLVASTGHNGLASELPCHYKRL